MTQVSIGFPQYVITAKLQNGVVQQIRTKAASAIVLARKWMDAGYEAVQIVDPLGKSLSFDGYRGSIMQGCPLYH